MNAKSILEHELVASILQAFPGSHVTSNGKRAMNELSPREIEAILAVSPVAGEYLEKLGKSDLATMEEGEWLGFIECTVMAYADAMGTLHAPYSVLRSTDDPLEARPTGPITEAECPF